MDEKIKENMEVFEKSSFFLHAGAAGEAAV